MPLSRKGQRGLFFYNGLKCQPVTLLAALAPYAGPSITSTPSNESAAGILVINIYLFNDFKAATIELAPTLLAACRVKKHGEDSRLKRAPVAACGVSF